MGRHLIAVLSVCTAFLAPVAASARTAGGSQSSLPQPTAAPAGGYWSVYAPLSTTSFVSSSRGISAASRVQFTPIDSLSSAHVITCWYNVDLPHQSTSTGLPNIHGHVDCDAFTARIVIQAYIYRGEVQVGASGIRSFYGQKSVVATANSATCVTGTFHGDEAGYIQAPPGYTPFERELYYRGPEKWVGCGGCGFASRITAGGRTTASVNPFGRVPRLMCFEMS